MNPRVCFMFFIAPLLLSVVTATGKIDPTTLADVFGLPQAYELNAAESSQVAAVNPDTLVDPDYWDSEDYYTQSSREYDKFDWSLTKRVSTYTPDNFLLSPLGLKLALAILTEAATGATQSELASVLGFDLDRNVVRRKFSSIIESLKLSQSEVASVLGFHLDRNVVRRKFSSIIESQKKESPEYILNLGSRIYVGDSAQPRQRFAAIAEEFYKTELKSLNFDNPTVAAGDINAWVANITQGRISNLVSEDDVRNMVVIILNTLYFKGTWRHQFNPNATKPAPFYVTPQKQINVPFMNVKDNFYYAESAKFDAKILRMPYRGNKFAMYIIVPNSLSGLPLVLNSLSDMRKELSELKERVVDVSLPKLQFTYTAHLDGVLKEFGVRQAFEDTASFPGIARGQLLSQRLHVSRVVQRLGIDMNELGSVIYAVTEIALVNKFGEETTNDEIVIANRPYLYFVQDEVTRQLLFTGRVSDPKLETGTFKV